MTPETFRRVRRIVDEERAIEREIRVIRRARMTLFYFAIVLLLFGVLFLLSEATR